VKELDGREKTDPMIKRLSREGGGSDESAVVEAGRCSAGPGRPDREKLQAHEKSACDAAARRFDVLDRVTIWGGKAPEGEKRDTWAGIGAMRRRVQRCCPRGAVVILDYADGLKSICRHRCAQLCWAEATHCLCTDHGEGSVAFDGKKGPGPTQRSLVQRGLALISESRKGGDLCLGAVGRPLAEL